MIHSRGQARRAVIRSRRGRFLAIPTEVGPSPKRRSVVELATPFAIRGNLASPSVETSAMGVTARALGRVALSPVNLLGSLLPFVSDRGLDPDNPCLALSIPEVGEP